MMLEVYGMLTYLYLVHVYLCSRDFIWHFIREHVFDDRHRITGAYVVLLVV